MKLLKKYALSIKKVDWILFGILIVLVAVFLSDTTLAASIKLPGTDSSDKLEAAGTLLRMLDTALFKWEARLFAGLGIMSAGWHLKEQRFGLAVISVIGSILIGTCPLWAKNIFDIGGGATLFS